jgi:very-short-patch-repair endonuclease
MIYTRKHLDEREYIEVAKNFYAIRDGWAEIKFGKEHRAFCECVATRRKDLVFTGQSACAILKIPRYDAYEFRPHAVCSNHKSSGITRWHLGPPVDKVRTIGGTKVVSPVRAICDIAGEDSPESLLVSVNDCLYRRLFTKKQLLAEIRKREGMKGRKSLERIVMLATDKSESPLETRGWLALYKAQFLMPTQQFRIYDKRVHIGRVDMYWEILNRRIVLELDGRLKYRDDNVRVEEKIREDRMRELGYEYIRVMNKGVSNGEFMRKVLAKRIPKRRNFGLLFPEG